MNSQWSRTKNVSNTITFLCPLYKRDRSGYEGKPIETQTPDWQRLEGMVEQK